MKNVADIYPLSPMQQGMLFHTLSSPDSGVYVEQLHCTLSGQLHVTEFACAWQQVIERHAALRTAFVWEGVNKPLQIVRQIVKLPLTEFDWRGLTANEEQQSFSTFLRTDRYRGFELTQAPLMRLTLIRLKEDAYRFVWSYHHIVLDGWSEALLLKEVFECYEAYRQGRELLLAQGRPYRDYIAWLQEQDLSVAESFWREALKGRPARVQLPIAETPTDLSLAPEKREQQLYLSDEMSSALQHVARRHQLTLNTLVQGAWAVLLSRYSGDADVVFGTVVAGRPASLAGVESIIGLFVNTLPVRVQVSEEEPVQAWLKELQAQLVRLREYEYSPLVQVQEWSETAGGESLFESLLVFENYPVDFSLLEQSGSLRISNFVREFEITNYPLTLVVIPREKLLLQVLYDRRRFEAAAIKRLLGHLRTLLKGMIDNADNLHEGLSDLPLLTEQERHQLLVEWNDTHTDYQENQFIHQVFEMQADRTPDAVAVRFADQQITYRELNKRANKLARYLQRLGVGPEVLVGLLLEQSIEMLVGMIGVLKAGGAYLPIDPACPAERLSFILNDAQVAVLVTQQRLESKLSEHTARVIRIDANWQDIGKEGDENLAGEVTFENLAYVIYTSGSTGEPKGVQITHRNLAHSTSARFAYYREPISRFLLLSPFSFDSSEAGIFWTLGQGGTLVVPAQGDNRDVTRIGELLSQNQISHLLCVPSLYSLLLTHLGVEDLRSLRTVIVAGESCPPQLVERHNALLPDSSLFNEYGPTEATVWSSVYRCGPQTPLTRVPIGRPIQNTQLYILDHERRPVPIGVSGELYIGGAGVARGYLNRPKLTAEQFLPNPFHAESGALLYKTGDLGRYLPDGNVDLVGRIDQQVKLRGYRIEPGEIEATLVRHATVREAVVITREEAAGEKRLVAYVLANQGQSLSTKELRSFLLETLPEYMVPSSIVVLEEFPLTSSGKIDRGALPALIALNGDEQQRKQTFIAPQNAVEHTLGEIWSSVLKLERVGMNDNFFELGGDSVLAIQIIARARQAGLQLAPAQIFQYPTVARLAREARPLQHNETSQLAVTGQVALTPIQHWFFDQRFADQHHFNQAVLLELREALNPAVLEKAVQHLLLHHDALRLRFTQTDSGWQQNNAASEESSVFSSIDLSTLPKEERGAVLEETATRFHASLSLSDGPLVCVALFDFGANEPGRLLVVIHHLAVDGVSWRILLDDLQTAYQQLSADKAVTLPPKTTSFKEWSGRLAEYAQSAAVEQEQSYWLSLPWHKVSPLSVDYEGGENSVASEGTVFISLNKDETQALLSEVSAAFRTQINEVLLTALTGAFAQWHSARYLPIDLEGHGREEVLPNVDLTRTVGWFTSVFPVLLELKGRDKTGVLLSIKEQLRRIPQRGIGYGVLRYLTKASGIADKLKALPQNDVSFNYLGQIDHLHGSAPLFILAKESSGATRSPRARRSYLLEINGMVKDGKLQFAWTYSQNIHKEATIEVLAGKFIKSLQSLISQSQTVQAEILTPSDFPLAEINQQQLSKVITKLGKASH